MNTFLTHAHSILRWAVLILLLLNIVRHFSYSDRPFSRYDGRIGLWLMIVAHTTLVIGLYQWLFGPLGLQLVLNNGMAEVMSNNAMRFWVVEHITCMLIGIALITAARVIHKKGADSSSWHAYVGLMYFVAFIIILIGIPWPFREIARPLFPGM